MNCGKVCLGITEGKAIEMQAEGRELIESERERKVLQVDRQRESYRGNRAFATGPHFQVTYHLYLDASVFPFELYRYVLPSKRPRFAGFQQQMLGSVKEARESRYRRGNGKRNGKRRGKRRKQGMENGGF